MKLYLNPGSKFDVQTIRDLLEQLCAGSGDCPAASGIPGDPGAQANESGADGRKCSQQGAAWAARLQACLVRERCVHLLSKEELGLLEQLPVLLARLNVEHIACRALSVAVSGCEADSDEGRETRLVTLRLLCGQKVRLVEEGEQAASGSPDISLGAALVLRAFAVYGGQSGELSGEHSCGRLLAFARVQTAQGGSAEGFLLDEGQEPLPGTLAREEILQLETNVDHLTGEEIGAALQELAAQPGVLDVFWLSGIGKKNRPMGLLRIMCHRQDDARVGAALLRHTHTLGYRVQALARCVVPRRKGLGALADGTLVEAKEYEIDGVWYCRPESDAVRRRAQEKKVGAPALRLVQAARPD